MKRKGSSSKRSGEDDGSGYVLVYSTGTPGPFKKEQGLKVQGDAASSPYPRALGEFHTRIERKGRSGKTVTVVYDLNPNAEFLRDLCASLKKSLGCGGTWYVATDAATQPGIVELQGDYQATIGPVLLEFERKVLKRKSANDE